MTEIKKQVTTGNLIQIGVTIFLIAFAWASVENSVNAHDGKILDHENRLRGIEKEIAVELSKINTKLTSIEKAVK